MDSMYFFTKESEREVSCRAGGWGSRGEAAPHCLGELLYPTPKQSGGDREVKQRELNISPFRSFENINLLQYFVLVALHIAFQRGSLRPKINEEFEGSFKAFGLRNARPSRNVRHDLCCPRGARRLHDKRAYPSVSYISHDKRGGRSRQGLSDLKGLTPAIR